MNQNKSILLGVTGSIAAFKSPELVRYLTEKGYSVNCVLTKAAEKFVSPLVLATLSGNEVTSRMFDDKSHQMPHLELANKADLMVIAPASASALGHLAHGISDDMVTLTYVTTKAPTLMAPAMHDTMWEHPSTQENVSILKKRGVQFVGPTTGKLADNNQGVGRMVEPNEIGQAIEKILKK